MEDADLKQEGNRALALIAERLEALGEELKTFREVSAEGPSAGHILALTQAVQYQGLLQFHDMMFKYASEVCLEARPIPEKGLDGPEDELRLQIARLVCAGLAKVMAPPFEKSLKAAFVAARMAVKVEEDVDDALKVEAALKAGSEPLLNTLQGFMTQDSWKMLTELTEKTGANPWKVIEEALTTMSALDEAVVRPIDDAIMDELKKEPNLEDLRRCFQLYPPELVLAELGKSCGGFKDIEATLGRLRTGKEGTKIVAKEIFFTTKTMDLLDKLVELTHGDAATLMEMALEAAVTVEASESLKEGRDDEASS